MYPSNSIASTLGTLSARYAVSVSEPAQGLPLLWTSHVHLIDPGEAVVLPIRNSDATYFVRGRPCTGQ